MATIRVNSENWPVNIISLDGLEGNSPDRETTKEFCRILRTFTAKKQRYANIIDLRNCGMIAPTERQYVGNDFKEFANEYRKYLVAVAVPLRSTVVRGALTAIGWIHPYPCEVVFVSSLDEGARTLQLILAKEGIVWSGLRGTDKPAE